MKRWWVWVIALFILMLISVLFAALKRPTHDPVMFRPDAVTGTISQD